MGESGREWTARYCSHERWPKLPPSQSTRTHQNVKWNSCWDENYIEQLIFSQASSADICVMVDEFCARFEYGEINVRLEIQLFWNFSASWLQLTWMPVMELLYHSVITTISCCGFFLHLLLLQLLVLLFFVFFQYLFRFQWLKIDWFLLSCQLFYKAHMVIFFFICYLFFGGSMNIPACCFHTTCLPRRLVSKHDPFIFQMVSLTARYGRNKSHLSRIKPAWSSLSQY